VAGKPALPRGRVTWRLWQRIVTASSQRSWEEPNKRCLASHTCLFALQDLKDHMAQVGRVEYCDVLKRNDGIYFLQLNPSDLKRFMFQSE
jgi:hypothetical protein